MILEPQTVGYLTQYALAYRQACARRDYHCLAINPNLATHEDRVAYAAKQAELDAAAQQAMYELAHYAEAVF